MAERREGFGSRRLTPLVRATLIALVAMFVLTAVAIRVSALGAEVYASLRLDPLEVLAGHKPWSLLTYALLHDLADPQHILFNGLGLYFFGPELEARWGARRLAVFMVLAALSGGGFILLAALLGLGAAPVVGASAIVMGIVVAWGLTFPEREIFFFFVLRLKGIHMVYASIALELLSAVSFSHVSAAAHFGGMAAGALYASWSSGLLRRAWLKLRLRRIQSQTEALRASEAARVARKQSGLRVIQGGAEPPKDKRTLN
jgi:membrane associated rhomboid family serine protease